MAKTVSELAREIIRRLDALQYLLEEVVLREDLREALKRTPDVARAVSRLALQRGSPRDLAAVRVRLVDNGRQFLNGVGGSPAI